MKRNTLIRGIVFCVLAIIIGAKLTIADESPPIIAGSSLPQWALPANMCFGSTGCGARPIRISENNVLYTTSPEGILAFYPDGSEPVLFPRPVLPYGAGLEWDYEPFAEEYILYFGIGMPMGPNSFYLQDLQTMDLTLVNLPTGFVPCAKGVFPTDRSFYRLGNSQKVLACGRHSIYVVDISSQAIEETISWTDSAEHFNPYVVAGENKQLYLFTTNGGINNEVLNRLVPNLDYQSYPKLTTFVLHRPVSAAEWSVIAISEDEFGKRSELEGVASLSSRFKIDQTGNLFYYEEWITLETKQSDLIKFDPQGERVWRVTETEMGDYTYLLDFLNDGSLLFWQNNTIEAERIVALNADAGPDQTVVAQNGISADVTLDGSNSSGENTIVSHSWTDENDVEISDQPIYTVSLAPGTYTFTLTVTDNDGLTGSDTVTITVTRACNGVKKRALNQSIRLSMPAEAVQEQMNKCTRNRKAIHRPELLYRSDYEIVYLYGAEFQGLLNYYALASDVAVHMGKLKYYMEGSLLKTPVQTGGSSLSVLSPIFRLTRRL